jgi:hypothetical protein
MSHPSAFKTLDGEAIHLAMTLRAVAATIVATLLSSSGAFAQTPVQPGPSSGPSVGMAVERLQDDFGVSGFVTSPVLFNGNARITVGGGIAWYPYGVNTAEDQDWIPFGQSRVTIEVGRRLRDTPLRLYGFGGAMIVFRPQRLAGEMLAPAGVGGFGFEFFMTGQTRDGPVSYFIELGGVGGGARATSLAGRPILLNGFLIQAGFRFYP